MKQPTVQIIEDDDDIRELIRFNLTKEGFLCHTSYDGESGYQDIKKNRPDLVVLDIMMPGMSGLEVCKLVKSNDEVRDTAIILLTAKGAEEDIVKGLESGADDYVTKPFSPKVLLARINAVLRRFESGPSDETPSETVQGHGVSIDPVRRKVYINNEEVELTFSEFQILHLLLKKSGWVFTRSQIVDTIRGQNHAITDRSVDVQIVGLRRKLGDFGNLVETVRGVGYRFKEIQTRT